MDDIEEQIRKIVKRAAASEKPDDAMKFSQAALNLVHAAQVFMMIERPKK